MTYILSHFVLFLFRTVRLEVGVSERATGRAGVRVKSHLWEVEESGKVVSERSVVVV